MINLYKQNIVQSLNQLRQKPLVDWPIYLQRILMMVIAVTIFFLSNKYMFNTAEKNVISHQIIIKELMQKLQTQQQVIRQTKKYIQQKIAREIRG